MKPVKATKAALLISSGTGSLDSAFAEYKAFTKGFKIQDMGIFTATADENKSEAKLAEITAFTEKL